MPAWTSSAASWPSSPANPQIFEGTAFFGPTCVESWWVVGGVVDTQAVRHAQSITHESVCLDVQLPRHPTDAEALELIDDALGLFVHPAEMCLSHSRQAVDLVDHDLRVAARPA
jgi:hypothetical protein